MSSTDGKLKQSAKNFENWAKREAGLPVDAPTSATEARAERHDAAGIAECGCPMLNNFTIHIAGCETYTALSANDSQQPAAEPLIFTNNIFTTPAAEGLRQFVELVARLSRDQECIHCQTDEELNDCTNESGHEMFDMESDDAVECLNRLISDARVLLGRETLK